MMAVLMSDQHCFLFITASNHLQLDDVRKIMSLRHFAQLKQLSFLNEYQFKFFA